MPERNKRSRLRRGETRGFGAASSSLPVFSRASGAAAVHAAVHNGHLRVLQLLAAFGADLNARNERGHSAHALATKRLRSAVPPAMAAALRGITEWLEIVAPDATEDAAGPDADAGGHGGAGGPPGARPAADGNVAAQADHSPADSHTGAWSQLEIIAGL